MTSAAEAMALLEQAEAVMRAEDKARWVPHEPTPKQRQFLDLTCREALYGGAAGGGKTDALLMAALQYVDVPGYSAVLFRRTHPQLVQPGGLVPRSQEWLAGTGAEWRATDKEWRFPSGARIVFGHLQHEADKLNWQGGEFAFVAFDELTQFKESAYRYLFSRLRRLAGSEVPIRMRSATNPGGPGHRWVKGRWQITDEGIATHPDRVFIPAALGENPHVDRDEYREALAKLDPVTRAQLEEGRWIDDARGRVYPITRRNLIPSMPQLDGEEEHILAIDLGTTAAKPTTAFVWLTWHPKVPGAVWVRRAYKLPDMYPGGIAEEYRRLRAQAGKDFHRVIEDEGALGAGWGKELRRRYGVPVIGAEKRNKLGFRRLLAGAIDAGEVLIVEPQCGELLEEADGLTWNEAGTDNEPGLDNHATDALLYGWREAQSFRSEVPDHRPRPGSQAAIAAEEQRMLDADLERYAKPRRRKWWQ